MIDNNFTHVVWEKKFDTGIPEIDEQHKKLVSLCNTFYTQLMSHKDVSVPSIHESLVNAFKECVNYVIIHSAYEEKLFREAGYPGSEKHKKLHAAFTQRLLETLQKFQAANFTVTMQLAKFLCDWILTHIAYDDRLYVPYVKTHLKNKSQDANDKR